MPSTGYIQVRAYSSFAQIPLKDVSVTITASDGTALAFRTTDRSGIIEAVALPTPDLSAGTSPNTGQLPFNSVNLSAQKHGYSQIRISNVQIFPQTVTYQELEMIPLSELPSQWSRTEDFETPNQNL